MKAIDGFIETVVPAATIAWSFVFTLFVWGPLATAAFVLAWSYLYVCILLPKNRATASKRKKLERDLEEHESLHARSVELYEKNVAHSLQLKCELDLVRCQKEEIRQLCEELHYELKNQVPKPL